MKGVTQGTYSAWLKVQGRPNAPVREASDADIQAIYRELYWNPVRGDDLWLGLDLVMVDYGWGSGPITAIEHLQRTLGVGVDGKFGPETLDAVNSRDSAEFINVICAERLEFFQRLPQWKYFGQGWTNRLAGIHVRALKMHVAQVRVV